MVDDKMKTAAVEALSLFLKLKGLRRTNERYAILEKVLSVSGHFTVEEIHRAMEADGFHVSVATVYNAMELFMEARLVRRHQFANHAAEYEKIIDQALANHLHLVCRVCGKVKEVKDAAISRMLTHRRYSAFSPDYFTLYVYGVCSKCQRQLKNGKLK